MDSTPDNYSEITPQEPQYDTFGRWRYLDKDGKQGLRIRVDRYGSIHFPHWPIIEEIMLLEREAQEKAEEYYKLSTWVPKPASQLLNKQNTQESADKDSSSRNKDADGSSNFDSSDFRAFISMKWLQRASRLNFDAELDKINELKIEIEREREDDRSRAPMGEFVKPGEYLWSYNNMPWVYSAEVSFEGANLPSIDLSPKEEKVVVEPVKKEKPERTRTPDHLDVSDNYKMDTLDNECPCSAPAHADLRIPEKACSAESSKQVEENEWEQFRRSSLVVAENSSERDGDTLPSSLLCKDLVDSDRSGLLFHFGLDPTEFTSQKTALTFSRKEQDLTSKCRKRSCSDVTGYRQQLVIACDYHSEGEQRPTKKIKLEDKGREQA